MFVMRLTIRLMHWDSRSLAHGTFSSSVRISASGEQLPLSISAQQMLAQATAPEHSASSMPRTLLVFAHQDDEVIALGARMARFATAHMVHVTDGAPRNGQDGQDHGFTSLHDYRFTREQELTNALKLAGLEHMSRECLQIPDQEASLRLQELTHAILARIEQFRPEVVLTHPYEGGHPDHDACAFAVHQALRALTATSSQLPMIIECVFYHAGPKGIETGVFLPPPSSTEQLSYKLTAHEQQQKQALLDCFTTQRATLSYFSCATESFRLAHQYDFTRPPHPAPVFYDHFPWGMTSARFCEVAAAAQSELARREEAACR